jgi:nucleoside-diphosphate-sugar epimerase
MNCLVTGANGFLGSHLVKKLLRRGERVVALVRRTSNLSRLQDVLPRVELRYARLGDYQSLREAFSGTDVLFHLAGMVKIGGLRKKELMEVNVEGSRSVFQAAAENTVRRVVYVSSISIFGSGYGQMVTEKDVGRGKIMSSYGASKWHSYSLFRETCRCGLPAICAIPSNIYGPDDPNFGPLFINYVKNRLKVMAGDRAISWGWVYVGDVCEALLLAAERGIPGKSYILNGENISLRDFFLIGEKITGIRGPKVFLPKPLVQAGAFFGEILSRILRQDVLLNSQSFKLLYAKQPRFDSTKAKRELGWRPRPLEETLSETLSWYIQNFSPR